MLDGIPLGRFASTWDIANAILFLGSAESDFITGQQIVVDGGFSLKGGVGNRWHARCRELASREQQNKEDHVLPVAKAGEPSE